MKKYGSHVNDTHLFMRLEYC